MTRVALASGKIREHFHAREKTAGIPRFVTPRRSHRGRDPRGSIVVPPAIYPPTDTGAADGGPGAPPSQRSAHWQSVTKRPHPMVLQRAAENLREGRES